ncbi:MAG: hypothetical protein ACC656_14815 [Candidatus Heimdallarchaeota archaeon]
MNGVDGEVEYQISINDQFLIEELEKLGKSYFTTNDPDLSAIEVVWLYRQQCTVERAFNLLKGPELLRVRPIFHSKDTSIRGHIFSCVLGLLLVTLLNRELNHLFPEMGFQEMLEALEDIKVAQIAFNSETIKYKLVTNSSNAEKIEKKLQFNKIIEKIKKK